MALGAYALKFEFEPASGSLSVLSTKTFFVKVTVYEEMVVHFSQLTGWNPPEEYQVASGFPVVFNQLNTNDHPVLHMQIDAQFSGDPEKLDWP